MWPAGRGFTFRGILCCESVDASRPAAAFPACRGCSDVTPVFLVTAAGPGPQRRTGVTVQQISAAYSDSACGYSDFVVIKLIL